MTDTLYGKVLSVETANLGEPASAAASIGATVLSVADAATFDELGGSVTINGQVLGFTGTDVDADTITMAVALTAAVAEGDMVEVYPPAPVKTVLVDLGDRSDPLPATVPLHLLDRLPDGTRDPGRQETVALQSRGTYEYVVADVTAEQVISQTLDYTEAEQGIGLSESLAQFQDVTALGAVSTPELSVDSVTLAGVDLGSRLDNAPVGKLLSARLAQQGSNPAITGTSTKLLELNCGVVQAGRTYRVQTDLILFGAGTLAISDRCRFLYRYTVDGSSPTTSSPTMDGGVNEENVFSGSTGLTHHPSAEVDIATDAPLKVGLFVQLLSGAGSYSIYAGVSTEARPIMSLYDDGPSGARLDSAISLTGGGVARFVKTFNALWAWGADTNLNIINDSYFHIGDDAYGGGGLYGLVGFDSTQIVSGLANSVTPVSVTLRWKPRTRKTAAGLDVRILSHNYASRSAAQAGESVPEQWSPTGAIVSRGTASNAVPNTSYDFSLTSLFASFKAGTTKGVGFANSSSSDTALQPDGSGSIYGNGTSECQLIFTYDGTS